MRFKKGDEVEVMSKKEVPASWRVAEIISGNGHTYNVKYDGYSVTVGKVVVEKVSRKVIRPLPPTALGVESWVTDDVVEVFVENSWKVATVLKVLRGDEYLIRPHGLMHEFNVHKMSIRVRQSWQDDRWILMGKSSGDFSKMHTTNYYLKLGFQVPLANAKLNQKEGDGFSPIQNDAGLQESRIVSSRTPKRASPYCSSPLEAYTGKAKKLRAVEKEGRSQRVDPARLLEKGHNWRHASLASNGPKMILGFAAFSWQKQWDSFCIPFLQIRQLLATGQPLI